MLAVVFTIAMEPKMHFIITFEEVELHQTNANKTKIRKIISVLHVCYARVGQLPNLYSNVTQGDYPH